MDRDGTSSGSGVWEEDGADTDTVEMTRPVCPWVEPPVDRRREARQAQEMIVTGQYGHHLISCTSGDLSDSGVFLRTSHPPPVGAFLRLGFTREDGSSLRSEGHVRWVKIEPGGRAVGCGVALLGRRLYVQRPH